MVIACTVPYKKKMESSFCMIQATWTPRSECTDSSPAYGLHQS